MKDNPACVCVCVFLILGSLCYFSGAVWVHHFICGLFPLGPPAGFVQQHPGDQGGCMEVHHPIQATSGIQGPKHRSMAGNPQRSGYFVGRYQREYCRGTSVCLYSKFKTDFGIFLCFYHRLL